jgi:hypothetical protein
MRRPVIINVWANHPNGEFIVAIVLDLHPDNITKIVNQKDGSTGIFYRPTQSFYKLAIPFKDYLAFHEEYEPIDRRYQEDVEAYYRDNFKVIPNRNDRGEKDII